IAPEQYRQLADAHRDATQDAIDDMTSRSVRDMRWLSNAKGRALRDAQREASGLRSGIRDQVAKEVGEEPIERARRWLTKGEMTAENGDEVKALHGYKLDRDTLEQWLERMFPEGSLGRPDINSLRDVTMKKGLHPDLVAEMFGLRSGEQLVRELAGGQSF